MSGRRSGGDPRGNVTASVTIGERAEDRGALGALVGALVRAFDHILMNVLGEPPSDGTRGRRRRPRADDDDDGQMVDPSSDQAMVDRARGGDRDAFRQLVERHQRRIYAVIRGMVRNDEDAVELTQEVFVKVYTSLDSFQGQSAFYTWLYRVAVNLTIDFRRKEWRVRKDEYDDAVGSEAVAKSMPVDSSPHRSYKQREILRRMDAALGVLNTDQRTAIVLREVDGLSYQEIADAMGCSQGTVMSRLFYARKKLQEELQDLR